MLSSGTSALFLSLTLLRRRCSHRWGSQPSPEGHRVSLSFQACTAQWKRRRSGALGHAILGSVLGPAVSLLGDFRN